jgi:protein gp37
MSKRMAGRFGYPPGDRSFEPAFRPGPLERLANTVKPGVVGVSFMGDLFGTWVPQQWIDDVTAAMRAHPRHTYLLLTKNPAGYCRIDRQVEPNWYLGTSVATWNDLHRIDKLRSMARPGSNLWVSFEPLIGSLNLSAGNLEGICWAAFGAMTGPERRRHPELNLSNVQESIRVSLDAGVFTFVKDNLSDRIPNPPRQVPWSIPTSKTGAALIDVLA